MQHYRVNFKVLAVFFYMILQTQAIPVAPQNSSDTLSVTTIRTGRNIMHDGFLMEWTMETARRWGNDSIGVWDIMKTPQGLAGYFRLYKNQACSTWSITLFSHAQNKIYTIDLPNDTSDSTTPFKFDRSDTSGWTIEWLLPWADHIENNSTSLNAVITGRCNSKILSPVLKIEAVRPQKQNKGRNSLIGRGILIGILALLYLMVQRRIRNQGQQKGFPHQST
jgi:hypothetical protein